MNKGSANPRIDPGSPCKESTRVQEAWFRSPGDAAHIREGREGQLTSLSLNASTIEYRKGHCVPPARQHEPSLMQEVLFQKSMAWCRLGGEGGIRTPDTVARMPHFECGAFNRSATSPVRRPAAFGGGPIARESSRHKPVSGFSTYETGRGLAG